jgi:hypothetical protein
MNIIDKEKKPKTKENMELIFCNKRNKSPRIKEQIIIHLGENNTSEKNVK